MKKLSRMEANKEVRRVLSRHYVDLSYCQYSVAGLEIRITGWLCKIDSSDFSASHIEGIVHEFQRRLPGYYVAGETDNWCFNTDHISYKGQQDKALPNGQYFESNEEETDYESEAS
jgi:hypothetical protein